MYIAEGVLCPVSDLVDCWISQDGYPSKIPAILVKLRDYLFQHGGLDHVCGDMIACECVDIGSHVCACVQIGIFRLSPDANLVQAVKRELNNVCTAC